MDLKEYQLNIIKVLIENEETIGELYSAYGDKFLHYKDFWYKLSAEEIEHANWIRRLRNKIGGGFIYFNEGRFKIEAIQLFLKYTREKISEAKNQEITILNALAIGLDMENSILEKKYFEIFEGDSVELKNIFLSLATATKEHKKILKEALEREKQLSN